MEVVLEQGIEGDLMETGVWQGGSCMLMAAVLKVLKYFICLTDGVLQYFICLIDSCVLMAAVHKAYHDVSRKDSCFKV